MKARKLILFLFGIITSPLYLFAADTSTQNVALTEPKASGIGLSGSAQNGTIAASKGPTGAVELISSCKAELNSPVTVDFKALCLTLSESDTSCLGNFETASTICITETNPSLLSTIAQLSALGGMIQSGINDSCSTMSKAMDIAKMGMAAYTTACGAAQKFCSVSCNKALSIITKLKTNIANVTTKTQTCADTAPLTKVSAMCKSDAMALTFIASQLETQAIPTGPVIAGKAKACNVEMSTLLGMSLINVANLMSAGKQSENCEKDTKSTTAAAAVDCTKTENKTKTECASTVVDCGLTANADKPICICKANPRVTGCEGVSTALATNSTMSTGGDGTTSGRGGNAKLTGAPDAATDKKFPADSSKTSKNDGSGIGGGSGGSTAGLSTNSGAGSSDGSNLEKAENAGNANILSNESGGGGGGYRFGFGGSSASKAQLRRLAGENGFKGKLTAKDWSAQVTSNGGKSNFDKVKVRYIENRTSLLNR